MKRKEPRLPAVRSIAWLGAAGIASAGEENDGEKDECGNELKKRNEEKHQASHVTGVAVECDVDVGQGGVNRSQTGDNERRKRSASSTRKPARREEGGIRSERQNGEEESFVKPVAAVKQGNERHDRSGDEHGDSNGIEFHWVLSFIGLCCGTRVEAPNENKMSDGGRDRASLEVEVLKSSQNWSAQRSAVRSIAWLDDLTSPSGQA